MTDTPVEGATYTVGNTIGGSSTVACVVTAPTATCTYMGLTNGMVYYYKNSREGHQRQLRDRRHTNWLARDAARGLHGQSDVAD